MKTPKRINFKRVTMWYQDGDIPDTVLWGSRIRIFYPTRIRIFYPNGKAEWCTLCELFSEHIFSGPPCWLKNTSPKTALQAFELAKEYDKSMGFGPMEFLGYL